MTLKVIKSSDLTKGGSTPVFPGKNRQVALSIRIQGVSKGNIATKVNKTHLEKIKTSPWNTPESYLVKSPIKLIPESTPVRRTIISEIGYNHFICYKDIGVGYLGYPNHSFHHKFEVGQTYESQTSYVDSNHPFEMFVCGHGGRRAHRGRIIIKMKVLYDDVVGVIYDGNNCEIKYVKLEVLEIIE